MRERFTLGIEEEYQLVEPLTGELRTGGRAVRRADRSGEVGPEMQDTMVEIGTPVCTHSAEVMSHLRDLRFQAGAAAAAEDLDVMAAGAHPFSDWNGETLSEGDRPRMLLDLFRQLVKQDHICGMHVHVAIPEAYDRLVILNTARAYTPHLLALSCSSPFHLGEDTGFASFRSIVWRRFPFTGTSPRFSSAREHREVMDLLLRSGAIPDERTVYWNVRPSVRYPTLEFRVCDVSPRLRDAVAIAALTRAIVVGAAEGILAPIGSTLSPSVQDMVIGENEWLAARDGLEAMLIAPEAAAGRISVRDAIAELVERLTPILEWYGDADAIRGVESILLYGNAADLMRSRYAELDSLRGVVAWVVEETRTGTGIDRRSLSRDAAPTENDPVEVE